MEIIKTIKPDQQGAKGYSKRYGERLCAVRYRASPCGRKLYTTVEIIVDEREREIKGVSNRSVIARKKAEPVALRIWFREANLREIVKEAGGLWSKEAKAWITKRDTATKLGLQHRIVEGLIDKCTDIVTSLLD